MTRFLYPDATAQLVYVPPAAAGAALAGYPGLRIPVYVDAALTTPADIQTTAGASLGGAVTVGSDSQLPDFLGPDGVDTLYVQSIGGVAAAIHPRSTAAASTSSAAAAVVQQTKVAGDTYARYTRTVDGGVVVSDGTMDPSTVTDAVLDLRGRPGHLTVRVRAAQDASLHSVQEWSDPAGALIAWLLNAGGFNINDDVVTQRSVFGPDGVRFDIYGNLRIGQIAGVNVFAHAGPPGNGLPYAEATNEVFQGSRGGSIGSWSIFSSSNVLAPANVAAPDTISTNPSESFHVMASTQSSAGNFSMYSNRTPIVSGGYAKGLFKMRAATAGRTVTPLLQWYTSALGFVSATNGTAVADTTSGWTLYSVGAAVPAGVGATGYVQLGGTGSSFGNGEVHYIAGQGVWTNAANADPNPENAWSPPQVNQPGTASGSWIRANAGDLYIRTDVPTTSGKRLYMCSVAGAPGVQQWVGIV